MGNRPLSKVPSLVIIHQYFSDYNRKIRAFEQSFSLSSLWAPIFALRKRDIPVRGTHFPPDVPVRFFVTSANLPFHFPSNLHKAHNLFSLPVPRASPRPSCSFFRLGLNFVYSLPRSFFFNHPTFLSSGSFCFHIPYSPNLNFPRVCHNMPSGKRCLQLCLCRASRKNGGFL